MVTRDPCHSIPSGTTPALHSKEHPRRRLLLLGPLLLLAACGGGDDGDSTGSSQVFPGTYRGPLNLTATVGPAGASQSGTIVIVVSPNQTVTVGRFPTVPLQGNRFTSSAPASALNGPGLTCPQGTFSVEGTFSGTTVNGTAFSNGIVCNSFATTLTGNYTAALQAQLRRGGQGNGDVLDTVQQVIRRALP